MTDLVQFIIIITALLVVFPIGISAVGGFGALFAATPPENISLIPIMDGSLMTGLGYVTATLILTAPTGVIAPDIFIRAWCAKDDRTAKNTLLITALLVAIFAFMLVMLGMAAKIMAPDYEHEMALPWLVQTLLPHGISGLVLVALMSAAISGAVPELVVCSSILARDVYQRFINPKADEKKLLKVSRWLTFFVGIVGMGLALMLPGFMDLTYNCYRIFVPTVLPACAMAFYSRSTTSTSALWSMITSGIVVAFMMIFMPQTFLTFADPVIIGLVVSIATLFIVNNFTKPTAEQVAFVERAQQQIADYKKSRKLRKKGNMAVQDGSSS
jgi:Na+/proline symporter